MGKFNKCYYEQIFLFSYILSLYGYKFDVILNLQIGMFYQTYGYKFVLDLLKQAI